MHGWLLLRAQFSPPEGLNRLSKRKRCASVFGGEPISHDPLPLHCKALKAGWLGLGESVGLLPLERMDDVVMMMGEDNEVS